ncbi:C1 family peptidase [Chloroflexota bacterium]
MDTRPQVPSPRGSLSLLDNLEYTPSERNQGACGNCWAWAGTGVMEIALDVQNGIEDRLSIQYLNSNYNGGSGAGFACCGGWLEYVADFYTSNPQAIPWSNTNASWQDGGQSCGESTTVPAGSISTTTNYPIDSIQHQVITTHGVTQATAIANIKSVLNQDKGVWFAFFLATDADWTTFFSFWGNQGESVVWDPDSSCGNIRDAGFGGHAVLCVGYNNDDADPANHYWIMVNSWGTDSGGRPNGIFRMAMDMDYSCYYWDPYPTQGYYSLYWQTLDMTWDLWESYSDTAREVRCDIYADYGTEHIANMYGTGFTASHNYRMAYYDGDGDNVREVTDTSDGDGNISSQHTFRETAPVDTYGDWHVIVCEAADDPPDIYNSGWANTLATDTFTVTEAAIPEFPTALAAISALALCAGVYIWMRRRAAARSA